ncbi:hypothetical protein, partial [Microcoleus sp. S13_C5]|uniref:hypothetical protein n=1 Tax=Microcoleus sp. S13_C5 TaxID=3055411 RepID=UPI002FCFC008
HGNRLGVLCFRIYLPFLLLEYLRNVGCRATFVASGGRVRPSKGTAFTWHQAVKQEFPVKLRCDGGVSTTTINPKALLL